jgi:hypothetical protein
MRIEFRVRPSGVDWEVLAADGTRHVHPTIAAALREAREQARVTWVDKRIPSVVRRLGQDAWETDVFYGLEGLWV